MNDELADTLVIPVAEELEAAIREGRSPAIVLALGGEIPIHIVLEEYWMSDAMPMKAEHVFAQVLADHPIKRFVFGVPVSYAAEGEGMQVGPPAIASAKLIWLLCFDIETGFDLCAMFYTHRNTKGGEFEFADEITMLTGEHQLLDLAPGFTLMRDLLATSS